VLELLGERERGALLRVGVRRRFSRGEVVFHEGDPGDALHIVTRGAFIARSSSTLGEVIAVNIFGRGDVFGELVLLSPGARRSATVVSHGNGSTLMITRGDFEELRKADTTIDRVLLSVLAERNRALTAHLVELLFTPVDQRVCRRLLAFADAVGAEEEGWVTINQTELATLSGTTRSTVNRVLRGAQDRGLVQLARGRIRLVDEPALRRRARVTPRVR
jgi:CRP/FNR family transcriptional regulator, cyclic AMP receptor protein